MKEDIVFEIFTDGSSYNNGYKDKTLPMFASCGIVITLNQKILRKASKLFDDKTISYAELKGAYLGLKLLETKILNNLPDLELPYKIKLYSDSQFVIKSINEWMKNWLKKCKNWKTDVWYNSSGGIVGQYEIFRDIKLKYLDNPKYDIEWIHIKGHTKKQDFYSLMNEQADLLATTVTKKEIKKRKL